MHFDNHEIFKYCVNNFLCVESSIARCLARYSANFKMQIELLQMYFLHFINNIIQNTCRWLLLLVEPQGIKLTVIAVFIFIIKFEI